MDKLGYRFSFGPWNIQGGSDPFGPPVRPGQSFDEKLRFHTDLGVDAVQFHEDDAVPNLDELPINQIRNAAREIKRKLEDRGLGAEFVAPRLWEDPRTVDGAYTSNDPQVRAYAIDHSLKAIDIANLLGTDLDLPPESSWGNVWR